MSKLCAWWIWSFVPAANKRPALARWLASLDRSRRVGKATVGFKRRFDLFQNGALLYGLLFCNPPQAQICAQLAQAQVGSHNPLRCLDRTGHHPFLGCLYLPFTFLYLDHPLFICGGSSARSSRRMNVSKLSLWRPGASIAGGYAVSDPVRSGSLTGSRSESVDRA